ncbi:hypothetical protein [Streptomyces halstedii]
MDEGGLAGERNLAVLVGLAVVVVDGGALRFTAGTALVLARAEER